MTVLESLTLELPDLRSRVQGASVEEAAEWSADEAARVSSEIRWCVEALTDLDARIKAVTGQHQLLV